MQIGTVAAKQLNDRLTNRVRTIGRASGEHAVLPIVRGRRAKQFETQRAIELPEDKKMREALDVREPGLKLGQDLEHTIGRVLGAETTRDVANVLVGTANESNRTRGKHTQPPPRNWIIRRRSRFE